jgi:uncharacterized BrkB/YihY/UPF0761 family membrane protein
VEPSEGSPAQHEPRTGTPADPDTGRIARTSQRLKREQSRLVRRVEDTRVRLERARPRSPLIDAGFRAFERDIVTGGVVLAGAVAFRVFLFLVPYVFVAVVGFGVAADAADRDPGDLARDAGVSGLVARSVSGAAGLSGFSRAAALVVGLIALFFGTRALLKVLWIAYGLIWGVSPPKLKKMAKPMLVVIVLPAIAFVIGALIDDLRDNSFVLGLAGVLLSALIPFVVALVISVYLPRQPTRWPDLVPGAAFLALGVLVLQIVTVYWIAHQVETKTDTYGAIGTALALLLWSYLLGRLVIASAVINASLWQRRTERAERRAARARSAGSRDREVPDGYTPPGAGRQSATRTNVPREASDGRTERRK